jgi:hypothetical protein
MDQTKRLINRKIRLEICVVDDVEWHEVPNDQRFNTVTVVMRDRATRVDSSKSYYRNKLPVLQNFDGGHHLGGNFNPRKGDLVYVLFYKEREGIVLGNAWSWAEYPVCRPTPYDIADKGGQWMEPYQDGNGDFPRQPYPSGKKPYCFRWFHGPVTGSTGPGRDWAWLFDYCHMGDETPSCKACKDIDCIVRKDNHGMKFYSSETESQVANPLRGEYFAPCGSYWMFDSLDSNISSEMFTEGKGFWTVQGALEVDDLKGHIRHNPKGSMDIHSTSESVTIENESTGTRVIVVAPDDDSVDYAVECKDFVKGTYIRLMKNGDIHEYSTTKIIQEAPLIDQITDLVQNHGNEQIDGTCTHGACSCSQGGDGGSSGGVSSGWPSSEW